MAKQEAFDVLDEFTQGYVQAALFTLDEEILQPQSGDFHENGGFEDALALCSDSILAEAVQHCDAFRADAKVAAAIESVLALGEYPDMATIGRHFWYTRNGHGVGFWEHDGPEYDVLVTASKAAGESYIYQGDDGLLYFS